MTDLKKSLRSNGVVRTPGQNEVRSSTRISRGPGGGGGLSALAAAHQLREPACGLIAAKVLMQEGVSFAPT